MQKIPEEQLKHLDLSVYGALRYVAERQPDSVAYDYMIETATFSELMDDIDRMSAHLADLGIVKGDRVIVCLPNCPEAVVSFYAIARLGAVAVMVHPLSSANEFRFYVENSRCKAAIVLEFKVKKFPAPGSIEGFETIISTSSMDMLHPVVRTIMRIKYGIKRPSGPGIVHWTDIFSKPAEIPELPEILPEDPVTIIYTGGTTGVNKGAVHTNGSVNTCVRSMILAMNVPQGVKSVLSALPMFHGFGLGTSVILPLVIGRTAVLVPNFTLKSLCKTIVRKKVSYIPGVPTLFIKLAEAKFLRNADLSFLVGIVSGGDLLNSEDIEKVNTFFTSRGGPKVVIGYGCSECLAATAVMPPDSDAPGRVGVPIKDVSIKIAVPDTVEDAPPGEPGEICVAGPTIMAGYYNNPAETDHVLKRHADGRLWIHTGDLGIIDDEGFVVFKSRIKRLIITSGYNVYPSQVEDVLGHHPAVEACCVVGVPDPNRGEKVKAYVVPKHGYEAGECLEEDISDYMKENIAAYAKPRAYEFVDSLPMTKLGKVDFMALQARGASDSGPTEKD